MPKKFLKDTQKSSKQHSKEGKFFSQYHSTNWRWIFIAMIILMGMIIFVAGMLVLPLVQKIIVDSNVEQLKSYLKYIGSYGAVFVAGLGTAPLCKNIFQKADVLMKGGNE